MKRLERRLDLIQRAVNAGATAPKIRGCQRVLRAAARGARKLARRTAKLVALGRLVPAARADRLSEQAARLDTRADVLSRSFCTNR